MKKILAKSAELFCRLARWAIPNFLAPHSKAVVAFVVPIVVANLARFIPSIQVSTSLVEQAIGAAVIALTVWATSNEPHDPDVVD